MATEGGVLPPNTAPFPKIIKGTTPRVTTGVPPVMVLVVLVLLGVVLVALEVLLELLETQNVFFLMMFH